MSPCLYIFNLLVACHAVWVTTSLSKCSPCLAPPVPLPSSFFLKLWLCVLHLHHDFLSSAHSLLCSTFKRCENVYSEKFPLSLLSLNNEIPLLRGNQCYQFLVYSSTGILCINMHMAYIYLPTPPHTHYFSPKRMAEFYKHWSAPCFFHIISYRSFHIRTSQIFSSFSLPI